MSNKILIFGEGFVGQRINIFFQGESQFSAGMISNFLDADKQINKFKPKIIINCIGSTGKRNVDDCELDKDNTLFSNTFIPIILAETALRHRIKLIHISSGCIYDYHFGKDRPITEKKAPDYFNLFYGRSKIYSERALEALSRSYNILIVRIRVPLDNQAHPKNLLTKLISYKKVIDIPNSVTYIPDFLKALSHLIKIDAKGIYNVVNKGGLRYGNLMKIYKKHYPDFKYKIIKYDELKLERTNLLLSVRKLEQSGFKVRNINEVLEECVRGYVKY